MEKIEFKKGKIIDRNTFDNLVQWRIFIGDLDINDENSIKEFVFNELRYIFDESTKEQCFSDFKDVFNSVEIPNSQKIFDRLWDEYNK